MDDLCSLAPDDVGIDIRQPTESARAPAVVGVFRTASSQMAMTAKETL